MLYFNIFIYPNVVSECSIWVIAKYPGLSGFSLYLSHSGKGKEVEEKSLKGTHTCQTQGQWPVSS